MGLSTELLSARQVCTITGLSHATLYRLIAADRFPRPIKLGLAAVRWRADEIDAHIDKLSAERAAS